MNNIFSFPPSGEKTAKTPAKFLQEMELGGLLHELKNQACILNLGFATLGFPSSSQEERKRHLAALQSVVGEMNLLLQRLDDGLAKAGHKRHSVSRDRTMSGSEAKQRTSYPVKIPRAGALCLRDGVSGTASGFDDETR